MSNTTLATPKPAQIIGPDGRELVASENAFRSYDGAELFYRAWLPPAGYDKIVILLHRGHEHSGRLEELAHSLDVSSAAIFAWDQRGHGKSPGERGWAEDFSVYSRDLECWVQHLSRKFRIPRSRFAIVAHSVAAVVAAAWVHDYAPGIRAMVLATPALEVKLYVPGAMVGLRALNSCRPRSFIKSYVGGRLLTHDLSEANTYDQDPAISRNIAVNILIGLRETSSRLIADAGGITTPTLLLTAGSDAVVSAEPQRRFLAALGSTVKRREMLPGSRHAIFHETGRAKAFGLVNSFLNERFESDVPASSLLEADKSGHTRDEYETLSRPLPFGFKRCSIAIQSAALETLGRLSKGIRIGLRHGFDSGESLDHVYANRAEGFTPLGRLIDFLYINSVGWKGIRQRKVHLERTLEKVLREAHADGRPLHVLDIASGPGRYLIETAEKLADLPLQIRCQDWSATGLAAGRQLAQEKGLRNISFVRGDAFDPEALVKIEPKPTVAVVSGLYELFPENARIRASLAGLHGALPAGGWLIYTNQPWHPQVEMIARLLPNREGNRWIMRRRTQAEMDELVSNAGFEKLAMEIDRWGIFTVSIARKVPRS